MSWSEAIWVGWLICISGVNHYKYSWPWSKLVWIFILPSGRKRVEWLRFLSAEQKWSQHFVWWTRTLDDHHGPVGMLSHLHMYEGCCVCLGHMMAVFDAWHCRTWNWAARQIETDGGISKLDSSLDQQVESLKYFEMSGDLQAKASSSVQFRSHSSSESKNTQAVVLAIMTLSDWCWIHNVFVNTINIVTIYLLKLLSAATAAARCCINYPNWLGLINKCTVSRETFSWLCFIHIPWPVWPIMWNIKRKVWFHI